MMPSLTAALTSFNAMLFNMIAAEGSGALRTFTGSAAADGEPTASSIEAGHYLDTSAGLVAVTPDVAARAISWSRG